MVLGLVLACWCVDWVLTRQAPGLWWSWGSVCLLVVGLRVQGILGLVPTQRWVSGLVPAHWQSSLGSGSLAAGPRCPKAGIGAAEAQGVLWLILAHDE